jgi:hypothetical protein
LTQTLLGILQGGMCLEAFGSGRVFEPVGSQFHSLQINLTAQKLPSKDPSAPPTIQLFNPSSSIPAAWPINVTFVDSACYSTVYRVAPDGFSMRQWTPEQILRIPRIPSAYLLKLPTVEEEALRGVQQECKAGQGIIPPVEVSGAGGSIADSNSGNSGGLDDSVIGGVAVGTTVAAALATALVAVVWRQSGHGRRVQPRRASNIEAASFLDSDEEPHDLVAHPLEEAILAVNDIHFETGPYAPPGADPQTDPKARVLLGEGRFGQVYLARLHGTATCAVKCVPVLSASPESTLLNSSSSSLELLPLNKEWKPKKERMLREVALLRACRSQHVVGFMGACVLIGEVRLVVELMPDGDLLTALMAGKVSWYRR